MRFRRAAAGPTLDERLEQLATAVRHGRGRVADAELVAARDVLSRAQERRDLAPGVSVAALLGATGSGKSSLLNAIVGTTLADVHVRRPTTTAPLAVAWDAPDSAALLDWLDVRQRHEATGAGLEGLVLLDLPDIDSTMLANRAIAARLAERVDVLVWVLDPQKYADGIVHEDYLQAMREHAAVSVVVLNQADRLTPDELSGVMAHLRTLLARDGLGDATMLATSAATGQGIDELRVHLATLAAAGLSAERRLAADARTAAAALEPWAAIGDVPAEVPDRAAGELVAACALAAGSDTVVDAVARSYRQRGARHVSWPPLRWLARLRPDPLRRLHLDVPTSAVTSLPGPTPAQGAAVRTASGDLARSTTAGFATGWADEVVADADARVPALVDSLDSAVAGTDLGAQRRPTWWQVWRVLGVVFFLVALAGAGWLGVLAVLGYLQIPAPPTPMLESLPWPTVLLIGGLVIGFLLAIIGRLMLRAGSRRASRRAQRLLETAVATTVREVAVAPLDTELTRYRYFTSATRAAAQP